MITIDNVEYSEDDLSDESKYYVSQLQDIEQNIAGLRFKLDQLNAAKKFFTQALIQSIEKPEE